MQAIDLVLTLPMTGDLSAQPREILRRMMDQWLPDFFRPMECHALISGQAFDQSPSATRGSPKALWPGETVGAGALTQLTGLPALTVEFLERMPTGDWYSVQLIGGLRFIEPDAARGLEWYGRVVSRGANGVPAAFLALASLRFLWDEYVHQVRLVFPILGYPLSGQIPRVDEQGMPAGNQSPDTVERNRNFLVEAFARGPAAIGLKPSEVSWSTDAEEDTPAATREELAALLKRMTSRD
jgi:hypothetical protein